MEDDDLFSSIKVAEITVSGHREPDIQVKEMWHQWVDLTGRPDRTKTDREVDRLYRRLLRENRSHGSMMRVVEGAAYLDRRPRDPRDVRRLIMALRNPGMTKMALALLEEDGHEIVRYPNHQDEKPDFLSTVSDIEEACDVGRGSWTSRDEEAAALLMEALDRDQVMGLADDTCRMNGTDVTLPYEMLRARHSKKLGTTIGGTGRSTYQAGALESDATDGIDFIADRAADRMHIKGVPLPKILEFHQLAPEGYWDAVIDVIEDGDASVSEAYDDLTDEWDWHPDDRK